MEHDQRCAPGLTFDGKTCFNRKQLLELCKAFNYTCDDCIKTGQNGGKLNIYKYKIDFSDNDSKEELFMKIKERLDKVCDNQICWLEQKFLNNVISKEVYNEIKYNVFRPDGPTQFNEWLSTSDIDDVMQQYVQTYSDFLFLGAVPSDCSKVDICKTYNLNLKDLTNDNKTKIGIVYNYDYHYESGSHWVALYIDLNEKKVYFFDPAGQPIPKHLMREFNSYLGILKKNIYDNEGQNHQIDEDFECGIRSINFIIRMIRGDEKYEDIVNASDGYRLTAKDINLCRRIYFKNTHKIKGDSEVYENNKCY